VHSPEKLATDAKALRDYAREIRGGAAWSGRVAPTLTLTANKDGNLARRVAVETLSTFYGSDVSHLLGRHLIAGTPAECVEQLLAFRASGADALICGLGCPVAESWSMLERIAGEILPALHKV
jgi:alkanesulfonate monooxygenase SsuD/methylene tetrahydromethanopterin reductase-like flavin-dependent oxidoreductase (luciferase family)